MGNGNEAFSLQGLSAGIAGDEFDPVLSATSLYFDTDSSGDLSAPDVAYVAVNPTAADKLARRLDRLGVAYRRRDDLMKPVLYGLSRRVDAAELFPDRDFPLR